MSLYIPIFTSVEWRISSMAKRREEEEKKTEPKQNGIGALHFLSLSLSLPSLWIIPSTSAWWMIPSERKLGNKKGEKRDAVAVGRIVHTTHTHTHHMELQQQQQQEQRSDSFSILNDRIDPLRSRDNNRTIPRFTRHREDHLSLFRESFIMCITNNVVVVSERLNQLHRERTKKKANTFDYAIQWQIDSTLATSVHIP